MRESEGNEDARLERRAAVVHSFIPKKAAIQGLFGKYFKVLYGQPRVMRQS